MATILSIFTLFFYSSWCQVNSFRSCQLPSTLTICVLALCVHEGTGTSAWTKEEALSAWHLYSLVRIYSVLFPVLVLTDLSLAWRCQRPIFVWLTIWLTVSCRISLYADDAGIFANPIKEDLQAISAILRGFEESSGLITNLTKTGSFAIRCNGIDVQDVLRFFPRPPAPVPRPSERWPSASHRQDFGQAAGVEGENLDRLGRVTLAKSAITAIVMYHITVLPFPKWIKNSLKKISRSFIWNRKNTDESSGGHTLVNWKRVCQPKQLGGLGIADLDRLSRALRLRWPSFQWTEALSAPLWQL